MFSKYDIIHSLRSSPSIKCLHCFCIVELPSAWIADVQNLNPHRHKTHRRPIHKVNIVATMKVAIVGCGTAGLGSAWLLSKYSQHQVELFEQDSHIGGHAHTVKFPHPKDENKSVDVDVGFIVFNTVTYPNFLRFCQLNKIQYITSDMTFSVSRDAGKFEWAGNNALTLFAQFENLYKNTDMYRMLWDMIRFNNFATELMDLEDGDPEKDVTIGEYLANHNYSQPFIHNYLIPMTAAIWSTPPDKAALDFPALTLIHFMHNHHLLQLVNRPKWLTIKGGSKHYVDYILSGIPTDKVHLNTKVTSVKRKDGKVFVTTSDSKTSEFDHIIFGSHADQTLEMLGDDATEQERFVLSKFEVNNNVGVLHRDEDFMPKRRFAWTAWNYLTRSTKDSMNVNQVSLTYWMNLLQSIPIKTWGPVLVTLNPLPPGPHPTKTIATYQYTHPLFTPEAVSAQTNLLPTIQNKKQASFVGAWTKYGFHEDGFSSGLFAARDHLGANPPFELIDGKFLRGKNSTDGLTLGDRLLKRGLRLVMRAYDLWYLLFGFIFVYGGILLHLYVAFWRRLFGKQSKSQNGSVPVQNGANGPGPKKAGPRPRKINRSKAE